MATLFHNPATYYRLTDDFYGFKCEPKQAILSRLKKSNDTVVQICNTLHDAGFELAHKTEEKFKEHGVYIREPMYQIPENRKQEYYDALLSIDRTNLAIF